MSKITMPSPVCKTGNGKQIQSRELLLFTFNYITIKQLFQGFVALVLHVWLEKLIEEGTLAVLLKQEERIIQRWIIDNNLIRNNLFMFDDYHGCIIAQYMKEHKLEIQSIDVLEKCEVQSA